jgi:hypothetical protein
MGFSRNLLWLMFGMIPFFLFSGCGDLEPEMQDTRSVVLKMNFNQRSSSRSSQITQSEVNNHKTHLILALPAWENLSSSYRNYYSSFAKELMNPSDNKVSLEIPLNTHMKIFAFLFRDEFTMPQLLSGIREVAYYGESQPFSIGTNTNSLSLGITLQSTDTTTGDGDDNTDPGTDTETETDDTTVPDNTPPTVATVSTTADNQSSISITDNITVTFSESMDSTSVTTNTDNTSCYGTLGLSSDNFSSCVRMSSEPVSSNSNMTFTLDPSDNLTVGTTYLTRVTTGVKDASGNAMSSQYDNSTGFTTTALRLNIDFGAERPDVPSGYAGAANQSGTWNKISSNSTNNLVDINNVSTSISLEVTAGTLNGNIGSGANLTTDNFYSNNGVSWKVEITGFSNGIYDIYYYAPAHSSVSTGSFYINSSLQNSISGSNNNELSQGTDWGMLSGVTVSNSTLTLESYLTSGYRGLAGLQIRSTQ